MSVFDCLVSIILGYASEVRSLKGVDIEKLHLDFCKRLLWVKKYTCNVMVYTELGGFPLMYYRQLNTLYDKILVQVA